jgi:hypothetical protein
MGPSISFFPRFQAHRPDGEDRKTLRFHFSVDASIPASKTPELSGVQNHEEGIMKFRIAFVAVLLVSVSAVALDNGNTPVSSSANPAFSSGGPVRKPTAAMGRIECHVICPAQGLEPDVHKYCTLYDQNFNIIDERVAMFFEDVHHVFSNLPPGRYYLRGSATIRSLNYPYSWSDVDHSPWYPTYYQNSSQPIRLWDRGQATPIDIVDSTVVDNIHITLGWKTIVKTLCKSYPEYSDCIRVQVDGVPNDFFGHGYSLSMFEGKCTYIVANEFYDVSFGTRIYFRKWNGPGIRSQGNPDGQSNPTCIYYPPSPCIFLGRPIFADTITAYLDYKYQLNVISALGTPTPSGWFAAWQNVTISVDSFVTEPPPVGMGKASGAAPTCGVRHRFAGWEGTGYDAYTGPDNPATFVLNGAVTETAKWVDQLPLVVTVQDTAVGSVLVDPPGIWQDKDSLVTLKAVAKPGYSFAGWSGSVMGVSDSVSFVMDSSKAVIALFTNANHPPRIAIPDTMLVEDDSLCIPAASIFAWVTDPGDPVESLTLEILGTEDHFAASLSAGGLVLKPEKNWNGDAWFAIRVSDPIGGTASDTVRILVTAKDDPPGPFGISAPALDFVYPDTTQPLTFLWHPSTNADAGNGDEIRYVLCLGREGASLDSVGATSDTSFAIPYFHGLTNGDYSWKVEAVDLAGNRTSSATAGTFRVLIETGLASIKMASLSYRLTQNYPNPFNPVTGITFAIPERTAVRIEVFSSDGRKVRTLVNAEKQAGEYLAEWDGLDDVGLRAVSGVYFCRMTAGSFTRTVKMTVMK